MIPGRFHDGHPRAVLSLATPSGPLEVEFIVDTGFDGDLAVTQHLAARLGLQPSGFRSRIRANGVCIQCAFAELELDTDDGGRVTEVLILHGQPLLGTAFMDGCALGVEVVEGGDVTIDAL